MADQSNSPFFKLPPELRNAIYGTVFQNHTIEVVSAERNLKAQPPGLLVACKQVYTEAVEIFYSAVIVEGRSAIDIFDWALLMPKRYYDLVPAVRLVSGCHVCLSERSKVHLSLMPFREFVQYIEDREMGFRSKRVAVLWRARDDQVRTARD